MKLKPKAIKEFMSGLVLALMLAMLVKAATAIEPEATGIPVYADFSSVEGLQVGDSIEMSGIAVGKVSAMELTPSLRAKVRMQIERAFPEDSSASIISTGLFGNKVVAIEAGGSEELITANDSLILTEGSLVLDKLLDAISSE